MRVILKAKQHESAKDNTKGPIRPFLLSHLYAFALSIVFTFLHAIQIRAQETEIKDYLNRSGIETLVYTGKEELQYQYPNLRGHPYLDTNEYREGELLYDGRLYPGVRLRLNTHTDALSILSPINYGIIVSSDQVEYARLSAYTILYIRQSPSMEVKAGKALPEGYYACIPMKKHPVYRREVRYPERKIEWMQVEWSFKLQSRLYIYKNGIYHSVGSKGSVLKLFKDKRAELNRYAKTERLNFRKDKVQSVVALVSYYESMTDSP